MNDRDQKCTAPMPREQLSVYSHFYIRSCFGHALVYHDKVMRGVDEGDEMLRLFRVITCIFWSEAVSISAVVDGCYWCEYSLFTLYCSRWFEIDNKQCFASITRSLTRPLLLDPFKPLHVHLPPVLFGFPLLLFLQLTNSLIRFGMCAEQIVRRWRSMGWENRKR